MANAPPGQHGGQHQPENWLRYTGQASWFDPLGEVQLPSFTCNHCNRVVIAGVEYPNNEGRGVGCPSCGCVICVKCATSCDRCYPHRFRVQDAEAGKEVDW